MAECRQFDRGDVRRAAREGLANGLRDHLPGAVGIVTKGAPLCGVGAFAHLALGLSMSGSAVSAALTTAGIAGTAWLRARGGEPPLP